MVVVVEGGAEILLSSLRKQRIKSGREPSGRCFGGGIQSSKLYPSRGAAGRSTNMRWKSDGKGERCAGSEDDNRSEASSNEVGDCGPDRGGGQGAGSVMRPRTIKRRPSPDS